MSEVAPVAPEPVLVIARIELVGDLVMLRRGERKTVAGVAPGVVIASSPADAERLLRKRWVEPGPPWPLPAVGKLKDLLAGKSLRYITACSNIDGRQGAVTAYKAAVKAYEAALLDESAGG